MTRCAFVVIHRVLQARQSDQLRAGAEGEATRWKKESQGKTSLRDMLAPRPILDERRRKAFDGQAGLARSESRSELQLHDDRRLLFAAVRGGRCRPGDSGPNGESALTDETGQSPLSG